MYESHWIDLIRRWQEAPASWRSKVLDEILQGKGVPLKVRPQLWLVASGGLSRMERFGENGKAYERYCSEFEELLSSGDETIKMVELQIRKDIKRTFPLFKKGKANIDPGHLERMNGDGSSSWGAHEKSLYNVLCAVSLCVKRVNYHQGLNYVTALLLLSLHGGTGDRDWKKTEESAFWVLVTLLNDYSLKGLYEHKSSFLQQYLDQFGLLVRRFLPRLHHHLEVELSPGFPVVLFAVEWFTTLYTYSLRLDAVYLVWDLFVVARLDEALYIAGLAVLSHLSQELLEIKTFEEMVDRFKTLVKAISARKLRDAVRMVTQRIVPSALIPHGKNTLVLIERAMRDSSNVLNTSEFDATRLFEAVQTGDVAVVKEELGKYKYPISLLESALMRATYLGFPGVVQALLAKCDPSCRSSLSQTEGLTPLHVCAMTGHPTIARILLNAEGTDRNLRCYSSSLDGFFSRDMKRQDGYTAQELASAICKWYHTEKSSVSMVLNGEVCLCCGVLLERKAATEEGSEGWTSKIWNAVVPDWDQAMPRASKRNAWERDYCLTCATENATKQSTILDSPAMGEGIWHCMHCKRVTLGERTEQCRRCQFHFCGVCAFTRRRLLPVHKTPVPVCQNCHHFLRSCPCQSIGENVRCFDVVCEHSAVDYCVEGSHFSPSVSSCDCRQCLKRRYALKHPVQKSRAVRYSTHDPLFHTTDALEHGYWGYGDRSILSVNESNDNVLRLIQKIEDLTMSRMKYCTTEIINAQQQVGVEETQQQQQRGDGAEVNGEKNGTDDHGKDNGNSNKNNSNSNSSIGNGSKSSEDVVEFRDYRAELIEFYTLWNPSQLSKVDNLLKKYKGQESKLLNDLQKMYAPY